MILQSKFLPLHHNNKKYMQDNKVDIRFYVLVLLIFVAAFSRMIPHTLNFSPLGSIGLFGAAYFTKKWYALIIPISATWLSDLFINNVIYAKYYPSFTWFYEGFYWQYASYILIAVFGFFIFKKVSAGRVVAGALASSVIFFLVSNFGCWIGSSFYPQSIAGLTTCYAAGVPFLKGTLLGDISYSVALFGSFELLKNYYPSLRKVKVKS